MSSGLKFICNGSTDEFSSQNVSVCYCIGSLFYYPRSGGCYIGLVSDVYPSLCFIEFDQICLRNLLLYPNCEKLQMLGNRVSYIKLLDNSASFGSCKAYSDAMSWKRRKFLLKFILQPPMRPFRFLFGPMKSIKESSHPPPRVDMLI